MFSKRLFGMTILLLGMLGFFVGMASAETPTCTVGNTHATFDDALADMTCDNIHLPSGSYQIATTLARTVTISGAGETTQIAPPTGQPIFTISADASVALSQMRLDGNGQVAGNGGIVANDGVLAMRDVAIHGGQSTHSGGGIYSTGAMTLLRVTMADNLAQHGGAIYSALDATLTIDDSDFGINFAGNGGSLYSDGQLTITNTIFDGGIATSFGGNLNAQGHNGNVSITDSIFRNGSASDSGGGAFIMADATIERTLFVGNFASIGGGLAVNGGEAILRDNEWRNNTAHERGGGLTLNSIENVIVENGLIHENTAEYSGGGLVASGTTYLDGSTVQINNSQIISNSVVAHDFETGGAGLSLTHNVTVTHSTIRYNSGTVGGGVRVTGSAVALVNNDISHNTATVDGGGIFVKQNGELLLHASTVTHNGANDGGGLFTRGIVSVAQTTIADNVANNDGGGIAAGSSGTISAERTTIAHNDAQYGGGLSFTHSSQGAFKNVTISTNSAGQHGGALHADLQSAVAFTHATIVNNNVKTNLGMGGGLYVRSDVTVSNSIIAGNLIAQNGQVNHVDCHEAEFGRIISRGGNVAGRSNVACTRHTKDQTVLATTVLGGVISAELQSENAAPATHALVTDSLAIDTIFPNLNGCGTETVIDQRSAMRPVNAMCDSGAYEMQAQIPTAVGLESAAVNAQNWQPFAAVFALLTLFTLRLAAVGLPTTSSR